MTKIDNKIKDFISKLYLYKALEGLVVFVLFFGMYFFVYLVIEYFFYLSSDVRTALFYLSVLTSFGFLLYNVIFPILQSFITSLQISKENASQIIGSTNKAINDRLLNLLQLEKLGNNELVEESIRLLEKDLFQYDLIKSISLKNLVLLSKLTILPILFLGIISLINFDGIVAKPANRIFLFRKEFKKPLDFKIDILNDSLTSVEGESFKLKFKVTPIADYNFHVFVDDDILETKSESDYFTYVFYDVKSDFSFRVGETKDKSYNFNLKVLHPPKINSLKLEIHPPKYTSLPTRQVSNLSDVNVAEGSKLNWIFDVDNISDIKFIPDSSVIFSNENYRFSTTISKSFKYNISISSKELSDFISLDYQVESIADKQPRLSVDILNMKPTILGFYIFNLSASDDYRLTRYGYQIIKDKKTIYKKSFRLNTKEFSDMQLPIDVRNMKISGDASIRFYVRDNDSIHGRKVTYSQYFPLQIFTDTVLYKENTLRKDSLIAEYSSKLNKKIATDSLNNSFSEMQEKHSTEKENLKELKQKIQESIKHKEELLQNLNSINDKELLEEINKALEDQKELLKDINEALKQQSDTKSKENKSEELKAKNEFQQKKTLNILRKIASSQMLKSMTEEAKELEKSSNDLADKPSEKQKESIKNKADNIEKTLEKYSKLKGSDKLEKQLKPQLEELKKEASKKSNSDSKKMQSMSKKIHSKLKSKLSTSMGGGESMSVDMETLTFLFNNYLSLSYDEEYLINHYNYSSLEDHNHQYNNIEFLTYLNYRLYNFAIANKYFTRASFNLIYPLQQYQVKFDDVYESNNSSKLNQLQLNFISDVNAVIDLLSDIIEQMNKADASPSSGDGEKSDQTTPQDLIEQQKQMQSGSEGEQKEGKGKDGSKLTDEEISEIIKRQEEIRNKYNELNGGSNKSLDKEIKELKKSLLKTKDRTELSKHQNTILKFLKDLKGQEKKKDKKRKSKVGVQKNIYNYPYHFNTDIIPNSSEQIDRKHLDYNEFYRTKLNK